jgi:hypothetical protein
MGYKFVNEGQMLVQFAAYLDDADAEHLTRLWRVDRETPGEEVRGAGVFPLHNHALREITNYRPLNARSPRLRTDLTAPPAGTTGQSGSPFAQPAPIRPSQVWSIA